MPVMIFVAGAIAGGFVGVIAGAIFQRRSSGGNVLESRVLPTAIAVIALVVAAVALAESGRDRDHGTAAAAAGTSTTTTTTTTTTAAAGITASSTTTTPQTLAGGLVTVPNVSHPPLTQEDAEAILKRAHFAVGIETLALSNVPSGYVISQNPLPEAKTIAGTTVTLVVSAAA
jgi:hypothetical protein